MNAQRALWPCMVAVCICSGCQWVPRSQYAALEAQHQQLAEQSRAQLSEISNLRQHNRAIEDQLAHTEQELAAVVAQGDTDRKRLAAYAAEREYLHQQFLNMSQSGKETIVPATATTPAPIDTRSARGDVVPWTGKKFY